MATPHVAGAWALIKQLFPEASVDDILNAFKSTGKTISPKSGCIISGNYPQKRIDVLAAMNYLAEQKQLTITKTGNCSGEISAGLFHPLCKNKVRRH